MTLNALPNDLRDPSVSTSTFKRLLKTRLFSISTFSALGVLRNALYKSTLRYVTYLLTQERRISFTVDGGLNSLSFFWYIVLCCCVGLPYGYVATGTASGAAAGSERLGQTGNGSAGGGTTYYATASPDYATPVSVVSIPRGAAGAPTSPPIRADQYVLQRILHGQTSRGTGLLSLHDFSSNELGSTYSVSINH